MIAEGSPQRERLLELDADLRPRLRAPVRVQHHAHDAVDAEPRVPDLDFSFLGKFAESLVEAYRRDMTDLDRHWLERLQVMGKVQSRYLWILLITMIFYGALQARVYVDTDPLKTPIVDLDIERPLRSGLRPGAYFVFRVGHHRHHARDPHGPCEAEPWTRRLEWGRTRHLTQCTRLGLLHHSEDPERHLRCYPLQRRGILGARPL